MTINLVLSTILLIIMATSMSKGQINTWATYLIVNNDIKRIDEWKFNYDSTGVLKDSINTYQLFYDKNGLLIKKKLQYENQEWTTGEVWESIIYEYDENQTLIKTDCEPCLMSGSSTLYEPISSKCETYDDYSNLITEVVTYKNGKIKSSILRYSEAFYSELLIEKITYTNGIISNRHKIIYTKN